jgi:2-polyprenyl-3-methyl-5-hydroxy-6-metoxy-1,4-benzoquinol methylase
MNQVAPTKTVYDAARAEAFLDEVATILNHGAVSFMLAVGHRTGLLDTLAQLPASTSAEIAGAAGLNERYVREWLAVMVTGGILIYDPNAGTYRLPSEHAASLTRGGQLGNLAVYAQFVVLAGKVEARLLEVFRTGEGIPYDDYPCFHQIMAEDSAQTVVAGIGDILATIAPDVVRRLKRGIDVLDAGCGAGRAAIRMAELYPRSRFVGFDLCEDAIEMARDEARRRAVSNASFEVVDLSQFEARERFDVITSFDAVHDTKDPQDLLRKFRRALRDDGVHIMQDIGGSAHLENNLDFPFAPLLYTGSCVHCTPVSLAQGGKGLGTMWGWETAEAMLKESGFASTERVVLPHDPMNVWFVSRKESDNGQ